MKQLFVILFSLLTSKAFSQTLNPNNKPVYFLDSVQIATIATFDPNKIESIDVVRDKDPAAPNGKIFIKSKNPRNFKFLSAQDIAKANNIPSETISIFMLDNEIIRDTGAFRIDSSYILKVEIIKGSEIVYLPQNGPSLAILNILTATEGNSDKQNIIRTRNKASNN